MPPPYVAYLRVYEPLGAFSPEERRCWRAYAEQGRAPTTRGGARQEIEDSVRQLVTPRRYGDDNAFITIVDDTLLVCPWRTALRSWETVLAVRGSMPELVAQTLVPPRVADVARAETETWRAEHPTARPHIRSCTWAVPVHWFTPFDERSRLVGGAPDEIVFRTSMADARRRCARALAVLRKSDQDTEQPEVLVEDLARWLEDFHPHGLVELDYAGLAALLSPDERAADRSAADVQAALAALARDDAAGAGEAYGRVLERWRRTQLAEGLN